MERWSVTIRVSLVGQVFSVLWTEGLPWARSFAGIGRPRRLHLT